MKQQGRSIGQLIRETRKARGMTQMDLAELLGVSYQQVQKYEKGNENISVERLQQIARALNVPITLFILPERSAETHGSYGKMPDDEAVLLQLYKRIKSKKAKQAVIELLKTFKRG
jgi:transcriptional regulator with XRE-family HTH domain